MIETMKQAHIAFFCINLILMILSIRMKNVTNFKNLQMLKYITVPFDQMFKDTINALPRNRTLPRMFHLL